MSIAIYQIFDVFWKKVTAIFFENLEKELKKRKLTLNKLSKEIGVSQGATSRWKYGGYPSIDVLANICKYLNVSADYLLELEPPDPPPDRAERLDEREQLLIEYYRAADERGKEYIFDAAKREASRAAPTEERSLNSKIG